MREKLIKLLDEAEEWADRKCDESNCKTCQADKMKSNCVQQLMVDRLIANGVTIDKDNNVPSKKCLTQLLLRIPFSRMVIIQIRKPKAAFIS